MRVLHLLGQTEDGGGILSVVRNLQEATRDRGVRHAVYVHRSYRETRAPALDYRFGRYCLDEHPNHLVLLTRSLRAAVELRQLLAAEPFDVVHGHFRGMLPALLVLATLDRRRVLFTNHAFARRTLVYRLTARHPRFHTVLLTRNMAAHYGLQPSPPKIDLIPDCCADRFFERPLVTAPRPADAGSRLILVGLGMVLPWKKWHLLLEAIANLPKQWAGAVEFHHYGSVAELDVSRAYHRRLCETIERFGLQSCAFLHGPARNVEQGLRGGDWFVLPSTNEPCSVALTEAMALGLPALVSRSGGNIDLVEEGRNGLCFEPDDAGDLGRCLLRILSGEARTATPEAIRESARWRSASAAATRYLQAYRVLTSQGGIAR